MVDCGSILIVDTDVELRSALSDLFGRAGFECVQATSGEEAVALARRDRPWLALLDLRLPDISGYEVCRQLRDEFGDELAIVFLSADRTEPMDRAAGFLVGADDYVVKPFDSGELLARVRRLSKRAPARHQTTAEVRQESSLTPRELEVLTLLAQGRRPRAIASSLVISEKTVSSHLQRVLVKLGVNSRTQAVAIAYRDGLISASSIDDGVDQAGPRRRASKPPIAAAV
jgi:DNA-binding NarL/FixJ family response regulator